MPDGHPRRASGREPVYRAITAKEARELKVAVLHPEPLLYAFDGNAGALNIGAFDGDRLVGVGSVWREALPNSRYPVAWRVTGMAVEPTHRVQGIGSGILGRLLSHAATEGGKLAWCETAPETVSLYRRYGFTPTTADRADVASARRVRMTSRLDRSAPAHRTVSDQGDGIRRIDTFPRLSRAVVFNDTVYIGGLLANRADVTVGEQTREILDQIDMLLTRAGTSRSRLISATIWLKDIGTVGEANEVWEAWVPTGAAPARACVQAVPGSPEFGVEIAVTAAL
jgi:enamine deaminase RidA (YjgF/YER057c/UK114 family)